jgi:hypothetical protein
LFQKTYTTTRRTICEYTQLLEHVDVAVPGVLVFDDGHTCWVIHLDV